MSRRRYIPTDAELRRALVRLEVAQGQLRAALAGRVPRAEAWRRAQGAAQAVLQWAQLPEQASDGGEA